MSWTTMAMRVVVMVAMIHAGVQGALYASTWVIGPDLPYDPSGFVIATLTMVLLMHIDMSMCRIDANDELVKRVMAWRRLDQALIKELLKRMADEVGMERAGEIFSSAADVILEEEQEAFV